MLYGGEGGGGVGNFRAAWIFFRYHVPCMNVFKPLDEYFLVLVGVHEFFIHLFFPCTNIFLYFVHPLPSYKFSNGPFLTGTCENLGSR